MPHERGAGLRRGDATPVRITTAATSRAEDTAGRQRRYLYSMAIRTLCVVGAVLVGDTWWRWLLLVGAVFLPYVAVIVANAGDNRSDAFDLLDAGYQRALPGAPEATDEPGRPRD